MSGAIVKDLLKLVGSSVILEVTGSATFSGVLYSVDADSGLVALRDNAIGHQADYNIVNIAHIVKFSSVGAALSAEKVELLSSKVPAVPEETLQKFYARESEQVCAQETARASSCQPSRLLFWLSWFHVLRSRKFPCTFKSQSGMACRETRSSCSTCYPRRFLVHGLTTQ
jgi:hypothetical protein